MRIPVPSTDNECDWIRLFLAQKQNPSKDTTKPRATDTTARRKKALKVFIVEDERLIAENLRFIAEENHWEVVGIASSGEQAVEQAELTKPDLILMDIRIQGEVDGVYAAQLIQQSRTNKPRILFLSAHSKEQFPHLGGLASNSFSYLKKPYTPEDVVSAVLMLLTKYRDS